MGTFNMKVFILTLTPLLVQLSEQASLEKAEYNYNEAFYWCPCTSDEYEEYYGIPYQYTEDAEEEGHAWCPCFYYDDYTGYEYAYENEWEVPADRNLDRKKDSKKDSDLDRKKKSKKSKRHH